MACRRPVAAVVNHGNPRTIVLGALTNLVKLQPSRPAAQCDRPPAPNTSPLFMPAKLVGNGGRNASLAIGLSDRSQSTQSLRTDARTLVVRLQDQPRRSSHRLTRSFRHIARPSVPTVAWAFRGQICRAFRRRRMEDRNSFVLPNLTTMCLTFGSTTMCFHSLRKGTVSIPLRRLLGDVPRCSS